MLLLDGGGGRMAVVEGDEGGGASLNGRRGEGTGGEENRVR